MTEPAPFVATFVSLYRQVHRQLRDDIAGLDIEQLNWTPAPETNSISTIIVHLLGSEAEALQVVRGLPSDRDRPSEFTTQISKPQELLGRIDAADRLLEDLAPQITDEDLATSRVRPSAMRNRTPQTGLFWLLNSYGHAREHLAHLQLTKQLLAAPEGAVSSVESCLSGSRGHWHVYRAKKPRTAPTITSATPNASHRRPPIAT